MFLTSYQIFELDHKLLKQLKMSQYILKILPRLENANVYSVKFEGLSDYKPIGFNENLCYTNISHLFDVFLKFPSLRTN